MTTSSLATDNNNEVSAVKQAIVFVDLRLFPTTVDDDSRNDYIYGLIICVLSTVRTYIIPSECLERQRQPKEEEQK